MDSVGDYGLIGDLETAALVGRDGSIDWCCLPRFDSGACFAALLGTPDNGRWLIGPACDDVRASRRYLPGTLVLETTFECSSGTVRLLDFMPPRGRAPDIVRIVEGVDGTVELSFELVIRFDYGRIVPWLRRLDHTRVAVAGPDGLCLRTTVPLRGQDRRTVGSFSVAAGERFPFTLTWFPSHERLPDPIDEDLALQETVEYWQGWTDACRHPGRYHAEVAHSLVVLKSLTYAPTGGIVAAPTTSLPELPGGVRNWDYRFCWLRDATLTLSAMLKSGYAGEAKAWRQWLLRAVAGDPADLQIMYGVAGERRLDERELEWLPGFGGAAPVRVGNAASRQLQLDVYGSVIDALYLTRKLGAPPDDDVWSLTLLLLEWLESGWRLEDAGIWEVRGPTRHFTHSKVMAWVAFDRAVRSHEEFGRDGPIDRWRATREEIRQEVLERSWSDERAAFAQSYGSDALDASVLMMPLVGFLDANDPRFVSTVSAIRDELEEDGLLRRYRTTEGQNDDRDGLPGTEGAFLACSFWLVEVLTLQGRRDEATALFERLLALRNDLGLLAEEADPRTGALLGNFPQALTHLSLVSAALALDRHDGLRDRGP